jgi:hypothetical protein
MIRVSITPVHPLVAQACLSILLHLDKDVTSDGLKDFPLAAGVRWIAWLRSPLHFETFSHLTLSFYRSHSNAFLLSINLTYFFDIIPSNVTLLPLTFIAVRFDFDCHAACTTWGRLLYVFCDRYHVPRDSWCHVTVSPFVFIISPLSLARVHRSYSPKRTNR